MDILLGYKVWSGFNIYLDLKNKKIYLENLNNKTAHDPKDSTIFAGITILYEISADKVNYYVTTCIPEKLKLDVLLDDKILKVDSLDISHIQPSLLLESIKTLPQESLTLKRGDKIITVFRNDLDKYKSKWD